MKKTKLLAPILGIAALSSAVVPLVGCSRNQAVLVTSVEITNTATEVLVGSELELTAKVSPENATNKELTWTVPEGTTTAEIVTKDGKTYLKGKAAGTVNVTAKAKDASGKSDTKTFTINPVLVESVEITNTKAEVEINDKLELTATVKPDNATNKELTWTVAPSSGSTGAGQIVTENNKVYLKGTAVGKVTVTATAQDDGKVSGTKEFTVAPTISLNTQNLKLGLSATSGEITATVTPTELADSVTWTSDDETLATVVTKTGLKTTIKTNDTKEGEVTITAKVGDKSSSCKVLVRKSFANKSWDDIATAANTFEASSQTKEDMIALCNNFSDVNYTDAGSTIEAHLVEFIGKTHNVTINTKEHQVRVIGINHDTIANSSTKALFTFDTVTLLSDSNGDKMECYWDNSDAKNFNYTNSILRANLTGQGDGTKSFSSTVFSMLPSELESSIKTVKKEVATSADSGTTYTVNTYNDTLFPLTMSEMAQTHESTSTWLEEGTAYKYWTDNMTGKTEYEQKAARLKKDFKGSSSYQYWLCSPSLTSKSYTCMVTEEGAFAGRYVLTNYCVSFGFCI